MKKGEYKVSIEKSWNPTHKVWNYTVEREDGEGHFSTGPFNELEIALIVAYDKVDELKIKGLGNLSILQDPDQLYFATKTREYIEGLAQSVQYFINNFYTKRKSVK